MHIPCGERTCEYYEDGECKLRCAEGVPVENSPCRCFYYITKTNTQS